MATVILQGTLDTKAPDCEWLISRLREQGVSTITVDVGSFSDSPLADFTSDEVILAAGEDPKVLRERKNRGEMMRIMGIGAAEIVRKLVKERKADGFLAFGGSGGSSVAAPVMQALPIGFPKLLVSTMASGNVGPYVGGVDATLMYSVVDVAGINQVSELVLGNAVAAIAGMAKHYEKESESLDSSGQKPVVAVSMFGLTTKAAEEAHSRLEELGYEVLVFHATGAGGTSMEKLAESGFLAGICDLTTTELCDDLAGGILSAGPERLEMAGKLGIPQVVSLGALDMVNFGPKETVPETYKDRQFVVHNPTITLMRTSAEENAELGRRIGKKLGQAKGPTEVFIPLKGFSGIDIEGGPFWDPQADEAAIRELNTSLAESRVKIHELDCHINDDGFGASMADALHRLITEK